MKKVRNIFMASVLALGLLAAGPVLAAGVNAQGGSNTAANQVRDPVQMQANILNGRSAMHPELLADPSCPTGPTVPWAFGFGR